MPSEQGLGGPTESSICWCGSGSESTAEFIAAANPTAVLELLDALDAAEAALEGFAEVTCGDGPEKCGHCAVTVKLAKDALNH